MRSQSKLLFILLMAFALGATGCGKKKQDPGAEALENVPDADTATVDDSSPAAAESTAAEAKVDDLPPIDGKQPFEDSRKAPAPEVKGSGEMATYTVQKGDTLMKIAFNIYGDIAQWKNLYDWNKDMLKRASQLEKGTQLKYQKPDGDPTIERNGDPYLIKKGDTLASIADDIYAKRNKWKKLWANNRSLIKNPNRIYAGFYLYYQITEEERKLAESIKAKRGGGMTPTADAGAPAEPAPTTAVAAPTPSAAAPAAAVPAAAPAAAAPAAAPATTGAGLNALKAGGLSALTAPPSRTPAAVPPAPAKK